MILIYAVTFLICGDFLVQGQEIFPNNEKLAEMDDNFNLTCSWNTSFGSSIQECKWIQNYNYNEYMYSDPMYMEMWPSIGEYSCMVNLVVDQFGLKRQKRSVI